MAEKKPVALWKGIVGTALSGTILLVLTPLMIFFTAFKNDAPLWALVTIYTSALVCIFSLILSIMNINTAVSFKKTERKQGEENLELLRQLLAEGKITIEEYDQLKK